MCGKAGDGREGVKKGLHGGCVQVDGQKRMQLGPIWDTDPVARQQQKKGRLRVDPPKVLSTPREVRRQQEKKGRRVDENKRRGR